MQLCNTEYSALDSHSGCQADPKHVWEVRLRENVWQVCTLAHDPAGRDEMFMRVVKWCSVRVCRLNAICSHKWRNAWHPQPDPNTNNNLIKQTQTALVHVTSILTNEWFVEYKARNNTDNSVCSWQTCFNPDINTLKLPCRGAAPPEGHGRRSPAKMWCHNKSCY